MPIKTMEDYRKYTRQKALAYYNKHKDDPEFKRKRKERNQEAWKKKVEARASGSAQEQIIEGN